MGLREFVELFDKNEVKNLFNALSSCIEYVRIDLHVFNIGAHVACLYSNDPELLSPAEGCNVNMIKSGNIMKAIANWLHCMTGYGEKPTSMP